MRGDFFARLEGREPALMSSFTQIIWSLLLFSADGEDGGGGGGGSQKQKTKRVRTSFTEDQLRVLHANFRIDSNPDGQDLERIAQQTGLSKRVTQVWFQNSRARQKKHQQTTSGPTNNNSSASLLSSNNNNNRTLVNNINNISISSCSLGSSVLLSGNHVTMLSSISCSSPFACLNGDSSSRDSGGGGGAAALISPRSAAECR